MLLSYIQPFSDGNKRTARITSNAILIANKYCPISFRTVDSAAFPSSLSKNSRDSLQSMKPYIDIAEKAKTDAMDAMEIALGE